MNPPPNPDEKPATIIIRTTMRRKTSYVKASKPGKLVDWMLTTLDAAAKAKGETPE